VISSLNISDFIDVDILQLPMSTTPQRTSDFIRLHLLSKYGGIWLDASILLTSSLDWIQRYSKDVIMYSIDNIIDNQTTYPVVENWFIACKPNCDFIEKWKDEFMRINTFDSPESYIADVTRKGTNLSSIFCTPYLSMHVAAQYVFQKQPFISTLEVLDAREGPYKHLRFNSNPLSFEQGISNLCEDTIEPVIKFRGIDREFMDTHPNECKCIFDKFFI
jgi:hypothetical protein